MSVTKLRASSFLNAMNPEQDNIDSLIRQAIGKEPFLSFSRTGDSPVQLIQLLHAFDQQGSDKASRNFKVGDCDEFKLNSESIFDGVNSFSSEPIGIKDPVNYLKGWESNSKGTKSAPTQMPSRKIPEAVVAFAQAAAKTTGEPEKSNLPGWPLLSPSKPQLQKCNKCSREFCSSINYRRHRRVHRRSLNVDKDSQKSRGFLGAFWDKLSVDEAKELVSLKNATLEEVTGSSVTKALSTWLRRPGVLASLPQGYIKAGLALLDVVQATPSIPILSQELFSVLDEASEKTFLCGGTALSLQKCVFDGDAVKKALDFKNIVACTSFLIEVELVKAWLVDKDAESLRCQKLLVDEEEAAQRRQAALLEKKRLKKLRQKEHKVNEMSVNGSGDERQLNAPPLLDLTPDSSRDSSPEDCCASEASLINDQRSSDFTQSSASAPDEDYGNAEKSQNSGHHVQSRPTQTNLPIVKIRHISSNKVVSTRSNGRKIWTIKSRPDNNEECGKLGSEVLIGSINVSLADGTAAQEKPGRPTLKLWRPVSRHGNDEKSERLLPSHGTCLASEALKAFLAHRWKEAVYGDGGQAVVISSSPKTEASFDGQNPGQQLHGDMLSQESDFHGRHVLSRVENRLAGIRAVDPASTGSWPFKFRPKPDKNSTRVMKYVPKQKSSTED